MPMGMLFLIGELRCYHSGNFLLASTYWLVYTVYMEVTLMEPSIQVVNRLMVSFQALGRVMILPMQKEGTFSAVMVDGGVIVSNLGNQPFLPWEVFTETVSLLIREGGSAEKGNVMGPRLGSDELPMNSVEGHVAYTVYGKRKGDSVFRRISPVANILVWSGICVNERGKLSLSDKWMGMYLKRDAS